MLRIAACGLAASFCLLATARPASAHVHNAEFGHTEDGKMVKVYFVKGNGGVTVRLLTLGAALIGVDAPDRNGKTADVVFGFDDVKGYQSKANSYFGPVVGRYANRIAKGKFTLDGKEYQLATNDGPNHLHGGNGESLDWTNRCGRPSAFPSPRTRSRPTPSAA
jgi:aldose 1-epimerase